MFEKANTYYNCFPDEEIENNTLKISDIIEECVDKRWIRLEFHESVLILSIVENKILSINDSGKNRIYIVENKVKDRIAIDIFKSDLDVNTLLIIGAICQNLIAGKAEEDMAQRVFYNIIHHDLKYMEFIEAYFPKWVAILNKFEKDKSKLCL